MDIQIILVIVLFLLAIGILIAAIAYIRRPQNPNNMKRKSSRSGISTSSLIKKIETGIGIMFALCILVPFVYFGFESLTKKPPTPEEIKANEVQKVASDLANKVEKVGKSLAPLKWHRLTVYHTKNGGYVYYLGTNTLNGLHFYWDGNLDVPHVVALDPYSARELGGVVLYKGADIDEILSEWRNSELASILNSSDPLLNPSLGKTSK
ncbi:hypothetical protein [Paenibacillus sp.]|uniref:hypothetical protein n=1 Tax=Paenibacillus sp. TaxID=58172 RepID=UPI00356B55C8